MKKALIIGAGPAGLTAAYELLTRTDIKPIIIEADSQVGGISKTIDYKGNKIDIGGHRFFSKSQRVVDWWLKFLPLDPDYKGDKILIHYQNQQAALEKTSSVSKRPEDIMLVRKRKSRIYYNRKFFDYPLSLNASTLTKLGLLKTIKAGFSYTRAKTFPIVPEITLEHFFINRFGKELYETFFRDYTAKVWGVPCSSIPASWGQQRVKDLDIGKMLRQALKSVFITNKSIDQKGTSTSLIEQFLYPRLGPGQMWEKVAAEIERLGGEIHLNTTVTGIYGDGANAIKEVEATSLRSGVKTIYKADYFFSTMPVRDLFAIINNLPVPANALNVARALEYRDFLIVGVLCNQLRVTDNGGTPITDNWIYIQDKNLSAGRLQFFHNWSPHMVARPGESWIGIEYFCNETDEFWHLPDAQLAAKAVSEIESIGIIVSSDVKDTLVVRVKKAYPSYYGAYADFPVVRAYLDSISNLFAIGRNGMHRYNNSDHSMLTAMTAVDNIIDGRTDSSNIWNINTGDEYHEESSS